MKKSQKERILEYLKENGSITPMEALNEFGCFRLSGRIFELKEMGMNIETEQMFSNGKVFARYVLVGDGRNQLDQDKNGYVRS